MARQSGFLMIIVAILLVVVSGLATAFVSMIVSGTSSSTSTIAANSAYDLASSGIENGSYQLSLGSCISTWSSIIPITGQGEYQYSCSQNQLSTITTSALTVSSTSIPLASVTNLGTFGAIIIDSEMIYYDGISGNTLLNARRGQNGTTAATHLSGATTNQSQYTISSQAGVPSLEAPYGKITLYQVVVLAQGSYYAVGTQGSNGVILNYNGSSWSTEISTSGLSLWGIETNTNYGLAVGYTSLLNTAYVYQFNGSSWSLLGTLLTTSLLAASCDVPNNPTLCWAVGQSKLIAWPIMYNTAGGNYNTTSMGAVAVSSVSCVNEKCMAALPNDVYSFAANSTTPFANRTNIGGTINGLSCTQNNTCVLARSTGAVHYYNGSSWSSAFTITSQSLNEVHCPNINNCMVAGNNGTIFNCSLPITSTASCVAQVTPGTINLLGVHCNSSNDCLAGGAGTIAYRYLNGTWSAISIPTSTTINSISGVGTGTGSGVTPLILHNQ